MAVVFNSNDIVITDGVFTFDDIYTECTDGSVQKLGDSQYLITKNLWVGTKDSSATLKDESVSVTITAELLQVYKGSTLELGTIDNGATSGGCVLLMPNVESIYGFGYGADTGDGRHTDNAGNFYAYGSTIKVYGFWAWFSGSDQVVELVDCVIEGYGRIEGSTSKLTNVVLERSHSKYGMLSPKGVLGDFSDVVCKLPGKENEWAGLDSSHKVYHNPKFAPQIKIVGGTYKGYDKLIYTEKQQGATNPAVIFLDSNIEGNYERSTKDSASGVIISNTFNPIIYTVDGMRISNADINITNSEDKVVFEGSSNSVGEIYVELATKMVFGDSTASMVNLNPFTITAKATLSGEDVTVTRVFDLVEPIKKAPFYIAKSSAGSGADIDYDRIQAMFDKSKDDICECSSDNSIQVSDKLDVIEGGLKQILGNVVDEINENETYFKETGFTIMI